MARNVDVNDQADPLGHEDPNSGEVKRDDDEATTTPSSSSPAPLVAAPTKREKPIKKETKTLTKHAKKRDLEEQPAASAGVGPSTASSSQSQAGTLSNAEIDTLAQQITAYVDKSMTFRRLGGPFFGELASGRGEGSRSSLHNTNTLTGSTGSFSDPVTQQLQGRRVYQLLTALQLESALSQRRQQVIVKTQDMKGYVGGNEETYDVEKALEFVESKDIPPVTADNVKKGKTRSQRKRQKMQEAKKKQPGATNSQSLEIGKEEAIIGGPSHPPAEGSELHVLAEKVEFKVNFQNDVNVKGKLDEDKKIEEKGSQEKAPLQVQPSNQDAVRVERTLIGFVFPNDGDGTQSDFDEHEAMDWMEKRVDYLKQLAREGKVTSKFV
ncbi:unnamed protein product [Orchesella dallaii]|uniref:Uncharacterized protein n=1 Tax=Orchesella dallaii TaxID=48710 RepID=A0ABP1PXD6_9HEXA